MRDWWGKKSTHKSDNVVINGVVATVGAMLEQFETMLQRFVVLKSSREHHLKSCSHSESALTRYNVVHPTYC